jgi:DNA-binding NtrC family response regulator
VPGQVLEALMRYDWPGNVRELQNAIQRYIAVKRLEFIPSSPAVRIDPVPLRTPPAIEADSHVGLTRNIEEAERISIQKALELCKGRKGLAAKALGISRKTLFRKMRRLEIS